MGVGACVGECRCMDGSRWVGGDGYTDECREMDVGGWVVDPAWV